MPMETQSNPKTDKEDQRVNLKPEEVTDKINLEEAEEVIERMVTEEVALEPIKQDPTSKREEMLPKKKRSPKSRSQNQLLKWKPSVSPSTISSLERPRLRRGKPEQLKV